MAGAVNLAREERQGAELPPHLSRGHGAPTGALAVDRGASFHATRRAALASEVNAHKMTLSGGSFAFNAFTSSRTAMRAAALAG